MKDMVLQEAVDKERAKRANAEAVKKMRDSSGDDLISDNRIRKRRVTSPNDSLSRFNQQIEAELNKEE